VTTAAAACTGAKFEASLCIAIIQAGATSASLRAVAAQAGCCRT